MNQLRKVLLLLFTTSFDKELLAVEDYFDVLSVENVPFPTSEEYAASLDIPYKAENIPEITVCLRFLIKSYNEGWHFIFHAWKEFPISYYLDFAVGMESGFEVSGYQATMNGFLRYVPGGGLGGVGFPRYLIVNFPRNIQTGEWNHYCFSYSTIIRKVHVYINGLKVVSYDFEDEAEKPFPNTTFHDPRILKNFRGLFTGIS